MFGEVRARSSEEPDSTLFFQLSLVLFLFLLNHSMQVRCYIQQFRHISHAKLRLLFEKCYVHAHALKVRYVDGDQDLPNPPVSVTANKSFSRSCSYDA